MIGSQVCLSNEMLQRIQISDRLYIGATPINFKINEKPRKKTKALPANELIHYKKRGKRIKKCEWRKEKKRAVQNRTEGQQIVTQRMGEGCIFSVFPQ